MKRKILAILILIEILMLAFSPTLLAVTEQEEAASIEQKESNVKEIEEQAQEENEDELQENTLQEDTNELQGQAQQDNLKQKELLQESIEVKETTEIKHIINIDTDFETATFGKSGIQIDGWKLATVHNTKLQLKIDGKDVEEANIQYMYIYDLISIVKGYGTYKENPEPNFHIEIPTTSYSDGKHSLEIQFVTEDGNTILETVKNTITIDKKIKNVWNIDTDLKNTQFGKDGIYIEGWKLATAPNTTVKVQIDGSEIEGTQITYMYKYDLISIVKGYGTYKENPKPNFECIIPTTNITNGTHKITIQFIAEDGVTILQKMEEIIQVDKRPTHTWYIDTKLEGATFGKKDIHIEGWKLAKEADTQIQVKVDGQVVEGTETKYLRKYDLISIVKGYGTYQDNPNPHFDIKIPTATLQNGTYTITIDFITSSGEVLETCTQKIKIDKSTKYILNIDTNMQNIIFNEATRIHIQGWKLADEPTKLNVLVDGEKISEDMISYTRQYDLISIVKGYGTYEENPAPNFTIDIPTYTWEKKEHTITIQFVTEEDGKILQTVETKANYGERYKGIDVSEFNGIINWKLVKANGIDFAMIRIGYRGYRTPRLVLDSRALENIRGAQAVGIKVGVYFVTQAIDLNEAQEEALWVIRQLDINQIKLDYPVAIDTEDSGARKEGSPPGRADLLDKDTRTMLCRGFLDVIRYQGRTPMIYASSNWYKQNLNVSELQNYDIWVADYLLDENKRPNFDKKYHIWQYSDIGNMYGISGAVDLNICYKRY